MEATFVPARHRVTVSAVPFDVYTCYHPYKLIGKGAYGLVCAAKTSRRLVANGEDEEVAIKKIPNIFGNDSNIIEAKRTLREIHLLRRIAHENVLSIRDVLLPSEPEFRDVYIVVEKMDSDMHRIIQARARGRGARWGGDWLTCRRRAPNVTRSRARR